MGLGSRMYWTVFIVAAIAPSCVRAQDFVDESLTEVTDLAHVDEPALDTGVTELVHMEAPAVDAEESWTDGAELDPGTGSPGPLGFAVAWAGGTGPDMEEEPGPVDEEGEPGEVTPLSGDQPADLAPLGGSEEAGEGPGAGPAKPIPGSPGSRPGEGVPLPARYWEVPRESGGDPAAPDPLKAVAYLNQVTRQHVRTTFDNDSEMLGAGMNWLQRNTTVLKRVPTADPVSVVEMGTWSRLNQAGNCGGRAAALATMILDNPDVFPGYRVAIGSLEKGDHQWVEMTAPDGKTYLVDPMMGIGPRQIERRGNSISMVGNQEAPGYDYLGQRTVASSPFNRADYLRARERSAAERIQELNRQQGLGRR